MNYIIGLDVGIGSIGWSVIRNDENCKRIEDFGVRIFDSGELDQGKSRKSQERRGFRSGRRLVTRRKHRKFRLKAHLYNIGFVTEHDLNVFYETSNKDIISVRERALSEKISPAELTASLIHICNYRGFNNFYENDTESLDLSADEKKELESEYKGAEIINEIMKTGHYRSVAEMYNHDAAFGNGGSRFRKYRNRNSSEIKLVDRKYLISEYDLIMSEQMKYYPQLTYDTISLLKDIIFTQRDFEDGPGNEKCKNQKYMGFLDTVGKCRFFKDESKGNRSTAIADIYAAINSLSQCIYCDCNGEKLDSFPTELSRSLVNSIIENGNLSFSELKKICKPYGISIQKGELKTDFLSKSFKFLPRIKKLVEECDLDWSVYSQNFLSADGILNMIGNFLSSNITPSRREKRIAISLPEVDERLRKKLIGMRVSGTANVCDKYMLGVINAFMEEGEFSSRYQYNANVVAENADREKHGRHYKLPAFKSEEDNEFFKNSVVFRAINETRKLVNAIVDSYGSPSAINIEVGTELDRTYEDRKALTKRNAENEKQYDDAKKDLEEKFPSAAITDAMILRYRLWKQQGEKCLYSGKYIDPKLLLNNDHALEVDHIIPFSLILDDTFENKALVYAAENQQKKQKTPLMYLDGDKKTNFIAAVNKMLFDKKISMKKYKYLMAESLDSDLLDGWKSRNLNDTRYISKYLKNYLRDNLIFAQGNDELYRERVYAVKSVLTSRFRRAWLNPTSWGTYEKEDLKAFTYLDHAVDAIVLANLIPAYAEIAQVQMKLARLYKKNKGNKTEEYRTIVRNCLDTMQRYYGMDRSYVSSIIENRTQAISPIISDLYNEVDIRVCDIDSFNYFDKKSKSPQNLSDEDIKTLFKKRIAEFYPSDPEFASNIEMPITSHKQSFKLQGALSKEQAISLVNIDGIEYQKKRKAIGEIKASDIDAIYSKDEALLHSLHTLLDGTALSVEEALKKKGLSDFVTSSGMTYKKVTVLTAPPKYYVKKIGSHDEAGNRPNFTDLVYDEFYCLEVYRSKSGKTQLTGIYPADIVKMNGKIYLKADYKYPDDYAEHIEYLYKRDYIELYENIKGKAVLYFQGFYNSCKNINRNLISCRKDNQSLLVKDLPIVTVKGKTILVKKRSIDILGKKGGYIKCGEPLSLAPEKKLP